MRSCVFFASDEACPCRVLGASAQGPLPEGIAPLLAERYCRSGRFLGCPIFRRFERSLKRTHPSLSAMMPPADERRLDDDSGVFVQGRRRRPRACG